MSVPNGVGKAFCKSEIETVKLIFPSWKVRIVLKPESLEPFLDVVQHCKVTTNRQMILLKHAPIRPLDRASGCVMFSS